MKIKVTLNGTAVNPWNRLGMTQNPFPQIGRAEYDAHVAQLDKLGAEPIRDVAHIRETLTGWSEEFVELCCSQFVKGKMVKFTVEFPEP